MTQKIKMSLYATAIAVIALVLAIVLPIAIPGPTGAIGPQGATGVQGEIGLTGIIGETGEQGIPGVNGTDGEKGNTGETGPNGTQGIPGSIHGQWVLVGTITTLGSQTFDTTIGQSSPIKIFWTATSDLSNESCLIVKLQGSTSGQTNVWKETSFLTSENKCGTEITLVNPNEQVTLSLTAKRGNFVSITADIYRFAPPL